jgi:hypothetical protein
LIETIPGVGDWVAGWNEIVPRSSGLPSSVTLPETASLGRSSTRAGPQALEASAPQLAATATKSHAGLHGRRAGHRFGTGARSANEDAGVIT